MTKDEALDLALEALELHGKQYPHMVKGYCLDAITAIKQALAAPVQEPVAWIDVDEKGAWSGLRYWSEPDNRHEVALYATPPAAQRQWTGLTDEEIESLDCVYLNWLDYEEVEIKGEKEFARAIEAKLKEKNNGKR
jgi:hypothetical protein